MEKTAVKQLAVITGGSSGIGYELARQCIQNEFDVIIAAENDGIGKAAETLAAGGATVIPIQVDLATRAGNEKLAEMVRKLGRPVDVLILNAGVGVGGDFARDTALEDEINLVSLNVMSPVHLAKRLLPDMVGRGQGRVLITSSIAALMPGAYSATYNASKAFLLSFAQAIREELKETGVTVTALMPGATETNFFRRAGMTDTKEGQAEKDNAEDVARDGFEAMMDGKDRVIAHSASAKFEAWMSEILPDTIVAKQAAKQARPGSAEQ